MRGKLKQRRDKLADIAGTQGGYFTASQALGAGFSYRAQSYHKSQGLWEDAGHGIYRLRDYPRSEHEDLIRFSLWSRNRAGKSQAVVSHETALAIHDLSDVMPAKTHLTVPPSFRKRTPRGVVIHKAKLATDDIEEHEGYRVTRPLRTLLDVAQSALSQEHLNRAVSDAVAKGLIQRRALRAAARSKKARARLELAIESSVSRSLV